MNGKKLSYSGHDGASTNPVRESSRESSVVAAIPELTVLSYLQDRNWPAYNEVLRRRSSLTIQFDPEMNRVTSSPMGGWCANHSGGGCSRAR